jgi:branched-chain amino acid transport system permease protein
MKVNRKILILIGVGFLITSLAIYPKIGAPYITTLILSIFLYTILAESFNIFSGYTGYFSFGHVTFFGVGAYGSGVFITKLGCSWVLASLIGGSWALILAVLTGYPLLRLKGPFFAIAMLGLSQTLRLSALSFDSLTGGGFGMALPPVLKLSEIYYAMGIVAFSISFFTYFLDRSKFGLSLIAIREDEIAAAATGINTDRYKYIAFLLSAVFPGIAGGIYGTYLSYIHPDDMFSLSYNIKMIIMPIFGGLGTFLGPIIGSTALTIISELLWVKFPFFHLGLYGIVIIIVVLYLPNGIMGLFQRK